MAAPRRDPWARASSTAAKGADMAASGRHDVTRWQLSHERIVTKWLAGLPVAPDTVVARRTTAGGDAGMREVRRNPRRRPVAGIAESGVARCLRRPARRARHRCGTWRTRPERLWRGSAPCERRPARPPASGIDRAQARRASGGAERAAPGSAWLPGPPCRVEPAAPCRRTSSCGTASSPRWSSGDRWAWSARPGIARRGSWSSWS